MVLAQLDLLVMWGEAMLSRNYFAELRYKLKIGWPNQGAEKLRQTKYFGIVRLHIVVPEVSDNRRIHWSGTSGGENAALHPLRQHICQDQSGYGL